MQCMTHDFRLVRRWARTDPGDGDERGDAVPTYTKGKDVLRIGFTPQTHVLGVADNRADEGEVIQRAYLSYRHDFKVGDRMGPANADAPDMGIYSVRDFPTGQILEVRPL